MVIIITLCVLVYEMWEEVCYVWIEVNVQPAANSSMANSQAVWFLFISSVISFVQDVHMCWLQKRFVEELFMM